MKHILETHRIRIGLVLGDHRPVVFVNDTHQFGALVDIEEKVVEWIGKLMGLNDPILMEFSRYPTGSAVLDALEKGEIDVTYSYMFQGGMHKNRTRRLAMIPSCVTDGYIIIITVSRSSGITTNEQLVAFLDQHPSKIGATSELLRTYMELITRPHNVTVICDRDDCFRMLERGEIAAAMTTWVPESRFANTTLNRFASGFVMSTCAFVRRDLVTSCGDGVVDPTLGEECEVGGNGCSTVCRCEGGYRPFIPAQVECERDAMATWAVVAIAVGSTAGTALLLVALGVAVVPCLRARYMRAGANLMRNSMISHRYTRQVNPADELVSPLAPRPPETGSS